MIENIWFYSSLPLVSAISCFFLLKKLFVKKSGYDCILLFVNLASVNLIQAAGYVVFSFSISLGEYFADAYLIALYFLFTHLLLFSRSLSSRPPSMEYRCVIYLFPIVLTLFHINGLMVDSYHIEQNSLMHNDGPLASCLDLFIFTTCFVSATFLWQNMKYSSDNAILVSKNTIALIAFIPFILIFCIVVLLSTTPYAIPVVVAVPMITIYTALTYYYLSRDKVMDLSVGVQFFFDRLKLAYRLLETHKTKTDLKIFHKAIEKQFIKEALKENNYKIQDTATYLDINHTTLRNKIKEYGLL